MGCCDKTDEMPVQEPDCIIEGGDKHASEDPKPDNPGHGGNSSNTAKAGTGTGEEQKGQQTQGAGDHDEAKQKQAIVERFQELLGNVDLPPSWAQHTLGRAEDPAEGLGADSERRRRLDLARAAVGIGGLPREQGRRKPRDGDEEEHPRG